MLRGGYGRSYDIGVFGSLFGHSVTQNLPVLSVQELNAPIELRSRLQPRAGPPAPVVPDGAGERPLPAARTASSRARCPTSSGRRTVDAFNVTVQRQLTDTMSVEVGYVGNRGRDVFAGDGPAININQAIAQRLHLQGVPAEQPAAVLQQVRLDAGHRLLLQLRDELPTTRCRRSSPSASRRAIRLKVELHAAAGAQHDGEHFETDLPEHQGFYDSDLNYGPPTGIARTTSSFSLVAELPVGRGRTLPVGRLAGRWTRSSAAGSSTPTRSSRAACRSTSPTATPAQDRDTGPNRPDLIGDPDGPQTRDQWFNATPIGSIRAAPSAGRRAARSATWRATRCAVPATGAWTRRSSSTSRSATGRNVELRLEAVNLFNHVNLGNPDSEVGVPGNTNTNAGRITSTAFGNADPQRNFQFAAKIRF